MSALQSPESVQALLEGQLLNVSVSFRQDNLTALLKHILEAIAQLQSGQEKLEKASAASDEQHSR